MNIAKFALRHLSIWRSVLNPSAPPETVAVDGFPVVPATDGSGFVWVRIVAGAVGGLVSALQSVTAALLGTFSSDGALFVSGPGNWSVHADPAANTQAIATQAAVAGSHVCTSITATFSNNNVAPTGILKVYLRDGASGVGAILWSANIQCGPNTGSPTESIVISGLNIVGTPGVDMTLEFSAAGGANTQENVTLTGYDAN